MNTFVHLHSSSRFDRSTTSLTAAATRYNKVADLVTYTEVEFEQRETAVRKANGKEFSLLAGDKGHANDTVISYKNSRFKLVYSEFFKASNITVFRSDGHPRDPIYSTIAVFEDKTNGKRFVVAVTHYASNVEGDIFKKNLTFRVRQWHDSVRNVKNRVNHLARVHKAEARLFVGDFNIDFKKLWCRALLKTIAPSYMLTWKKVKVAGGTHGRRIIDATFLRGKMGVKGSAVLFTDDASSDHRPYKETLVWL